MSLYAQASTVLDFRCSEKGAAMAMTCGQLEDRGLYCPQAGAEIGDLGGSTSLERHYGVIRVKHSQLISVNRRS